MECKNFVFARNDQIVACLPDGRQADIRKPSRSKRNAQEEQRVCSIACHRISNSLPLDWGKCPAFRLTGYWNWHTTEKFIVTE
jgi:hypothetical protein